VLLPPQADLLILAVAGVGLIGTLVYLVRGGRLFWVVIGGGIFTAVFTILFVITLKMTSYVVHVTGGATMHAERGLRLGTDEPYAVIINDSDRTLTLRGAVYSAYGAPGTQPADQTIQPHSEQRLDAFVDFLGPNEPFPREVESPSSATTKYWLTW
jgi:hypothetical protein